MKLTIILSIVVAALYVGISAGSDSLNMVEQLSNNRTAALNSIN